MFKIALAKGRISEEFAARYNALRGREVIDEASRRLVFDDIEAGLSFILVKPVDLPVYVSAGAADAGIIGKDVLLEEGGAAPEVMDLDMCRCRMVLAGPAGGRKTIRSVATKYPKVAVEYLQRENIPAQILKLSGSLELAPVVGLSDCIIDLVDTGRTLVQNGLVEYDELFKVSTRAIVSPVSLRMRSEEMNRFYKLCEEIKELGETGGIQ
ncbi:MAG TPA: ATP phosphoribosyltransferase [Candidatus Acidoferrum sp.]|nr:ATP phosphoribosyltransferase [Candidatus Acidoferrum sp.]